MKEYNRYHLQGLAITLTGVVAILLVDILFPHAMESTFYRGHFHRVPELGFISILQGFSDSEFLSFFTHFRVRIHESAFGSTNLPLFLLSLEF